MSRSAPLLLALAAAVLAVALAKPAEDKFTTKYDNVNLDDILRNERLLNKYIECLMGPSEEGCTADGKELRKAVPDALTNECAKCSEKQKVGAEKVIKHLTDHKPQAWKDLQAKYDPQGLYAKRYASKAAERGVAV